MTEILRSKRPSGDWAEKRLLVIIPTVNGWGASAGAGAGRAYGVTPGRGLSGEVCHGRCGHFRTQRAERERAPQVRMRCESNWGNAACEYRFANERRARRQFVSHCGARERVEMISFDNPQVSHWQGFAAIYADGGICRICPATRSDASDRLIKPGLPAPTGIHAER
eukprot:599576-Pleurochrysis_carterae.AAC.1